MFERGWRTYTPVPTTVKGDFGPRDGSGAGRLAAVVPLAVERAPAVGVERAHEDPVGLDGPPLASERDGPVRDTAVALEREDLVMGPQLGWRATVDPRADDLVAAVGRGT